MSADLEFTSREAQALWRDFLKRLDWENRSLSKEERHEIQAEAAAHIQEALAAITSGNEADRLREALAQYGELPPAPPLWRRPLAIALHYGAILLIGTSGLFLPVLLHMAIMEMFNPAGVGLWINQSGDWALSYEVHPEPDEILGAWFSPAILIIIATATSVLYGVWQLALAPNGPVARWMKD